MIGGHKGGFRGGGKVSFSQGLKFQVVYFLNAPASGRLRPPDPCWGFTPGKRGLPSPRIPDLPPPPTPPLDPPVGPGADGKNSTK